MTSIYDVMKEIENILSVLTEFKNISIGIETKYLTENNLPFSGIEPIAMSKTESSLYPQEMIIAINIIYSLSLKDNTSLANLYQIIFSQEIEVRKLLNAKQFLKGRLRFVRFDRIDDDRVKNRFLLMCLYKFESREDVC